MEKNYLAVGFNGIDYSSDVRSILEEFSDEGYYTVRFLNDTVAYAAGKGKISQNLFSNKKTPAKCKVCFIKKFKKSYYSEDCELAESSMSAAIS